jgi:hypothetical protein
MYSRYENQQITEDQFLSWYRDPGNYRPEAVSANRSRQFQ